MSFTANLSPNDRRVLQLAVDMLVSHLTRDMDVIEAAEAVGYQPPAKLRASLEGVRAHLYSVQGRLRDAETITLTLCAPPRYVP